MIEAIGITLLVIAFIVIAYCDVKHFDRVLKKEKEEREDSTEE